MKKETKIKLLLIAIFIVIALVAVEITLRFTYMPPQVGGYPEELFISDAELGYRLNPSFEGSFGGRYEEVSLKINERGLRDDPHEYKKPEDTIRILALGDSVTMGAGVPFAEVYLNKLEDHYNKEGKEIEIINAGVNGYELTQIYSYYKNEVYKYDPDIVLMSIVLNDIFEPNTTQLEYFVDNYNYIAKPDEGLELFVKKACYTCVFTYSLFLNYNDVYIEEVINAWQDKEKFRSYKEKVIELNQNLSSSDKKLILVIFPYTPQFENYLNSSRDPQEKIKSMALEQDIAVIDLLPHLDKPGYHSEYIPQDTVHLNIAGNSHVEKILYEELNKLGVLS